MYTTALSAYAVPDGAYPALTTSEWRKVSSRRTPIEPVNSGTWSPQEHRRFLTGVRLFPNGPWRLVAEYVGKRNVRQVQTHHQKILEKTRRHRRGLIKKRKPLPDDDYLVASPPPSTTGSSSDEDEGRSEATLQPETFLKPLSVYPQSFDGRSAAPWPDLCLTTECSAEDLSSLLDLLCDDMAIV